MARKRKRLYREHEEHKRTHFLRTAAHRDEDMEREVRIAMEAKGIA